MNMTKRRVEDVIARALEDMSFEEILEDFDLTPEEVFWTLFKLGHIDQDLFERNYEND